MGSRGMASGDLGAGRLGSAGPGPPGVHCVLRSRLLTFFMKMVSCREHLSTFSFRTEMSLRVLGGDVRGHLSQPLREASRAHMVSLGSIPVLLVIPIPLCVLLPWFLA